MPGTFAFGTFALLLHYGGAFSFNTEVGIGPAIPEYESLAKFISQEYL